MVVMDRRLLPLGLWIALLPVACVKDPKIEDEVAPNEGLTQPKASGSASLTAGEACDKLATAAKDSWERLSCKPAFSPSCPEYVALAGATPCASYNKASVEACADAISGYSKCADFDQKPCVATLYLDSCSAPHLDAGVTDTGVTDTGVTDTGVADAQSDASTPSDSSAGDAAPALDSSVSDAASQDAAGD